MNLRHAHFAGKMPNWFASEAKAQVMPTLNVLTLNAKPLSISDLLSKQLSPHGTKELRPRMTDPESHEQFVRANWIKVSEYFFRACGLHLGDETKECRHHFGDYKSLPEAYAAAYDFTVQRLKQIAEVKYELSLQRLILGNHENQEWRNPHDHEEDGDALKRTITRLESALADLKRGMKP